jgi:drug/metabolite transporter (DMT)-like permease
MKVLPHVSILIAILLWATSVPAGKLAVQAMPVSEILIFRFGLAGLLLWLALALLRRTAGIRAVGWPAFWLGLLVPAAATLTAYWSFLHTSAVHAVVITAGAPVTTSLIAWWLLNERPTVWVTAGTALAALGIGLLVSDDSAVGSSLWGDFLCFLSVLFAGFAQVGNRRLGLRYGNTIAITAWQMLSATLACFAIMAGFESWLDQRGWMAVPSPDTWLLILYLAVFVTALPFALANFTLSRMPAGQMALYTVLMAPLGVPASAVVLGEPVTSVDIAALVLVTVGVALPALGGVRRNRASANGRG